MLLYIIISFTYICLSSSVNQSMIFTPTPSSIKPRMPDNIPYVLSIQKFRNMMFEHICVGTLITNNIVLTSANCLLGLDWHLLSIAGDLQHAMSVTTIVKRYNVIDVKTEPHLPFLLGETALLKIYPSFSFKEDILPKFDYNYHVMKNWTNGFVVSLRQIENNRNVKVLEFMPIKKLTNIECSRKLSIIRGANKFCATNLDERTLCSGDTGAPLFSKDLKYMIGFVDNGDTICQKSKPIVCTHIRPIKNWITSVVLYWKLI